MSQDLKEEPEEPIAARLTDADVAAYLESRPDFLVFNPDLVDILELPKRAAQEGVTDFHTFAVGNLRKKLAEMTAHQEDLKKIVRDNIRAQETIHKAVLSALEAEDAETFLHCVLQRWTDILDIEAIALGHVNPPSERLPSGNLTKLSESDIAAYFAESEDGGHCFINTEGDAEPPLFGPAAPLVKSYILMRLTRDKADRGVLALGWREADGFGQGRGTETLRFLTDALTVMLERWAP